MDVKYKEGGHGIGQEKSSDYNADLTPVERKREGSRIGQVELPTVLWL